ncbi:MAG TPA: PDZ domain-containing protein [Gaiellaceae bacterium]|nr:PDZ domain-containing protein [Gaiellaceae bacterium]
MALGIAAAVFAFYPSDHYIFLPDPARAVEPLVHVQGEKEGSETGGVYMVDVVIRKASLLERYFPGIHEGATLIPADVYNPQDLSERVQRRQSLAEMSASQTVAATVALRRLGYDVRETGVDVNAVDVGAPADGVLEPGDVIVGAQGKEIRRPDELTRVMADVEPGETVTLRIRRAGTERTVEVGTRASDDQPPRAVMGILIQPKFELPVKISIDTGDIGGPSAGLAFTLDIIDELGPNDLDRGRRIVATGEMALDGTIHEIGGIEQKTIGAREADADVFLVPDANAAGARRYAHGLRIVPVSNIDEALRALATG